MTGESMVVYEVRCKDCDFVVAEASHKTLIEVMLEFPCERCDGHDLELHEVEVAA